MSAARQATARQSAPASLRHRLEHGAFRAARSLLRALPEAAAAGVGAALGRIAGDVLRIRRPTVHENLRRAFPEAPPAWIHRIARASYRHLGCEAAATVRLLGASREAVRAATEVEGWEEFQAAAAAGRGVVLVTAHLGNWEVGAAALAARGLAVEGVVQVQRNRRFDADLARMRAAAGVVVVPKGDAPRRLPQALREGRVAALLADQTVLRGGVRVPFLGASAPVPRGPAVFALRTGAPLWAGAAVRLPGGSRARYRVLLQPVWAPPAATPPPGGGSSGAAPPRGQPRPALPAPSASDPDSVGALTAAHLQVLEGWIRRWPEQYFWLHRRRRG
ncbi:MAG: lysophospholipid acyltransferase family protein [Longimicrobiales bacterium]|nr:lysophospholipid acyltransferase family protein [Longimicrobiales bacterium]